MGFNNVFTESTDQTDDENLKRESSAKEEEEEEKKTPHLHSCAYMTDNNNN